MLEARRGKAPAREARKKKKRKLTKRERRARLALTYGRGPLRAPRTFLAALLVLCLYVFVLGAMEQGGAEAGALRGSREAGPDAQRDAGAEEEGERMVQVDFEVFGTVQKVSMRKYTQKKAKELGVGGSIENSESSTVKGTLRGPERGVRAMQDWLRTTGSPKARIERAEFANERDLEGGDAGSFSIKKVILANGKQWA